MHASIQNQSFQMVRSDTRGGNSSLVLVWYPSNNNFSEVAAAPRPDTLITGADQSEESCGFMPNRWDIHCESSAPEWPRISKRSHLRVFARAARSHGCIQKVWCADGTFKRASRFICHLADVRVRGVAGGVSECHDVFRAAGDTL